MGSRCTLRREPCVLPASVPTTCRVHFFSFQLCSPPAPHTSTPGLLLPFFFQFGIRVLPVIYLPLFFSPSFLVSPVAPANSSTLVPLSPRASEYCSLHPHPCRYLSTRCDSSAYGDNSALAMESHLGVLFSKQREKGIDTGPLRADKRRVLLWLGHPADSCPEAALYTCGMIPSRSDQSRYLEKPKEFTKGKKNLGPVCRVM